MYLPYISLYRTVDLFPTKVALLWWAKITFLINAHLITTHTSRVLEFGHSIAVSYEVYKQTTSTVLLTRFAGLGTALLLGGLITTLVQVRARWILSHIALILSQDVLRTPRL